MPDENFISHYLIYNQGNEVPRNYHIWSALALISAIVSRKVFIRQGYFTLHGNIYVGLIGDQGSKKTTAKDIAMDLLLDTWPDAPLAGSVDTKEYLTYYLGKDEAIRAYLDERGDPQTYRPYILFINELKHFLRLDPSGMLNLLTDAYDRNRIVINNKNAGRDVIENPSIVMLACETPHWVIRQVKGDIITGGFLRRIILVYEKDNRIAIPIPEVNAESLSALRIVKDHLKKVMGFVGEFKWTPDGQEFFKDWYYRNKKELPDDEAMRGYLSSKDSQLLKVAMLLDLCYPEPGFKMTSSLLETAMSLLNVLEKNMPLLTIAAGRSELAVPQQKIIAMLESHEGILPERLVINETAKDLDPYEQKQVIQRLLDTEQIHRAVLQLNGGMPINCLVAHQRWLEGVEKGEMFKPSLPPRPSVLRPPQT